MAGLPGTGLGGIFYALLVFWMTLRELWFAARGVGESGRWRLIARFGALLGGIILALWAEGWLLRHLLGPLLPSTVGPSASSDAVSALTPALAAAPFIVLALLMLTMHAARLLVKSGAKNATDGPVAEPTLAREAA